MNAQTPPISLKDQLNSVEERIERLLQSLEKYATENAELKKREKLLTLECNELRQRNEKAGSQLESMINRLKQQPVRAE
jgi:uncharacterized protein (TIGR02449 family)